MTKWQRLGLAMLGMGIMWRFASFDPGMNIPIVLALIAATLGGVLLVYPWE